MKGSTRSRVQLCHDTHREDDINCKSISLGMGRDYPGECTPNANMWFENWYDAALRSGNWYQHSEQWINYGDAGYNDDLRATYQLAENGQIRKKKSLVLFFNII